MRSCRTLYSMTMRSFFPVLFGGTALFALMIHLLELFTNLVRYLNLEVPFRQIALVHWFYLPKSIMYAVPIAVLFAVSFTMGTLYANNELIAVFSAGVPLRRFVRPFLVFGILISIGAFYFEDHVVIRTQVQKTELSRSLLRVSTTMSNTNVTVLDNEGRHVYHAEHYNDQTRTLTGFLFLERLDDSTISRRIDAGRAVWENDVWTLFNAVVFRPEAENPRSPDSGSREFFDRLTVPELAAAPSVFRRRTARVDEMPRDDARIWIESLRRAGLPYRNHLTEYYSRYSYAATPFIVALISSGLGGKFKKNVLLMSLLVSLCFAVVYYITGMLGTLAAAAGLITPIIGAWAGVAIFVVVGMLLFKASRN
ncbi:MAG: YjgP/YjgQ family permease [Spirochaetaceae bacterium]|nr:MAG: YjgP/YjgQ family permease [Spirochaetaceae bacterium]